MDAKSVSKIEQFALVTYLANRFGGGEKSRLGKKAMQKYVHLIQSLGGVDCGYRFSFYTYGPYSASLAADLDFVSTFGGVEISYNATDNFYIISPGAQADAFVGRGQALFDRAGVAIDSVLEKFGGRLAKDLELVSTIAFLRSEDKAVFEDDRALVKRVLSLKPKYSENQVETAISEVREFLRNSR